MLGLQAFMLTVRFLDTKRDCITALLNLCVFFYRVSISEEDEKLQQVFLLPIYIREK